MSLKGTSLSHASDTVDQPRENDLFTSYFGVMATKYAKEIEQSRAPHRLSHLQALKDKLTEFGTKEPSDLADQLKHAAEKLVRNLMKHSLTQAEFEERSQAVKEYLKLIRVKLADKPPTVENVIHVIKTWHTELSYQMQIDAGIIAAPKKAETTKAPTPASVPASTPSVQSALVVPLPPEASSTSLSPASEVIPRLKIEHPEYLFAFLSHVLKSKIICEAIAHEVRYFEYQGKDDLSEQEVQSRIKSAEHDWKELEDKRFERLKTAESKAPKIKPQAKPTGKEEKPKVARPPAVSKRSVEGITSNSQTWLRQAPQLLNKDQMDHRNKLRGFVAPSDRESQDMPQESKEERKEAQRRVNGYEPCVVQTREKAVALDMAKRLTQTHHTLVKQVAELPDAIRTDMRETTGVLPISLSRQSKLSAVYHSVTGGETWQTEFASARLEEDAPKSYPERRALAEQMLWGFVEKRAKVEALRVAPRQVEQSETELQDIVERLAKVRLQ